MAPALDWRVDRLECPWLRRCPLVFSCAIFLALTTCAEAPGCRQEATPLPLAGVCMAG